MKKILKWIIPIIVILILLFICFNKNIYTIKANKVDSYSPDRILEVYKDNKKITNILKDKYDEVTYFTNEQINSFYDLLPRILFQNAIEI